MEKELKNVVVISEEQAKAEIEKWLKAKRVTPRMRKKNEQAEETLIGAIQDGYLVLNDDLTLTQKLIFPTKEDGTGVNDLKFKLRMSVDERSTATKGYRPDDGDGRMIGYIAHLCGTARGIIGKLDSVDFEIAQSIAIYFL